MTITAYDIADLPDLAQGPHMPDTIGECVYAECNRKLVAQSVWEHAKPEARKTWMKAGFYKLESYRACRLHATRVAAAEHNQARKDEAERNARYVAGKYRGLVRQGFKDPLGEISHQLGLTIEYVQRLLRRAGQEYGRRDERKLRRDAIIEEVQFFRSMGRGLVEIAQKVGMTTDQLAESLRHWKLQGVHDMDLDWLDTHFLMNTGKLPYSM